MNTLKLPQILVTGLSGMVGSRFEALYGHKYDFFNLDITKGIDITNADHVNQVFEETGSKIIIHLAAFTNVTAAHEQVNDKSGSCYQVNVIGTKTIAEAAAKHEAHIIHISTDYVFDGIKLEPYTEEDSPHPIEWYGQTKLWAEEEVKKAGASHTILRLAFPYQAKPSRPDFLGKIRENLSNNTLPPAFADHYLTPTFVDDAALTFDYCINQRPTGLYHMVGSTWATDYEIAGLVKQIFELPGEVKPGSLTEYLKSNPRPYQKTMKVSNQKLVREFGIKMTTLEEGLTAVKTQL